MFTTKNGQSAAPPDQQGTLTNVSVADVVGVGISTALTGTLTISAISPINGGQPMDWVIPAGTVGVVLPPGSGAFYGVCSYRLSSPADAGKWFFAWSPR
jgi:hypothetical protein